MSVQSSVVIVSRPADGVGLVEINRPEARNALNLGIAAFLEKRTPSFEGR